MGNGGGRRRDMATIPKSFAKYTTGRFCAHLQLPHPPVTTLMSQVFCLLINTHKFPTLRHVLLLLFHGHRGERAAKCLHLQVAEPRQGSPKHSRAVPSPVQPLPAVQMGSLSHMKLLACRNDLDATTERALAQQLWGARKLQTCTSGPTHLPPPNTHLAWLSPLGSGLFASPTPPCSQTRLIG